MDELIEEDIESESATEISGEIVNFAPDLDERERDSIARQLYDDIQSDLDSRREWERMHAEWMRLYYQIEKPTESAWEYSCTESVPLLAESCNQFQSRTFQSFFPSRAFVEAVPIYEGNEETEERAERVARFMNLQLSTLDKTYKKKKNETFLAVALHGSDFTKTYFDPIRRRIIVDRVRAQDFIVPYAVGAVDISELDRKTHRIFISAHKASLLVEQGYFIEQPSKMDQSMMADEMQEAQDEAQGVISPVMKGYDTCMIYECHTVLDLDEDGIAEPYIVVIDAQSKKMLRITPRYETDAYGVPIDNKKPIEMFTHYQFLPNPDGFYGFGMGHLLGEANKVLNKMLRMNVDASELATVGNMSGIVSESLGLKKDELELSIGKFITAPMTVEDINKSIYQFRFPGPTGSMLEFMQYIQNEARRLTSASDFLSGTPDKVYQPTAMLAMIDQGLQLFSSVQEFLGLSLEDELQKVYKLNAGYLSALEYYDPSNPVMNVTHEDFAEDLKVVPVFDPRFATRQQKLAKAEAVYQFALSNPLMQQNPDAMREASENYLRVLEVPPEVIEQMLPEPPPPPPPPQNINDQNLENALFVLPPDQRPLFDVFPDQDHAEHIRLIDEFVIFLDAQSAGEVPTVQGGSFEVTRIANQFNSEDMKRLLAELMDHRRKHLHYFLLERAGYGQGSTMAMAATPDDALAEAAIRGEIPANAGATLMLG